MKSRKGNRKQPQMQTSHAPLLLGSIAVAILVLFISSQPQDLAGKAAEIHGSDVLAENEIVVTEGTPQTFQIPGRPGGTITFEILQTDSKYTSMRISLALDVRVFLVEPRIYLFGDVAFRVVSVEKGSVRLQVYPLEVPQCIDEDGGINAVQGGATTLIGPEFERRLDRCENGSITNLIEYYCRGTERESVTIDCSRTEMVCIYDRCSSPCQDSDGLDPYVFGSVEIFSWEEHTWEEPKFFPDECAPPTIQEYPTAVIENSCQANRHIQTEISCGKGEVCSEGRCMTLAQFEAASVRCSGSRGINPYVRGAVSLYRANTSTGEGDGSLINQYEDSCIDAQTASKYYCRKTYDSEIGFLVEGLAEEIVTCPAGYSCSEGRCLQEDIQSPDNLGDLNADGFITEADLDQLQQSVTVSEPGYTSTADIDGDGLIDSYDIYLLSRFLDVGRFETRHPVRNLLVRTAASTGLPLASLYSPEDAEAWGPGRLEEGSTTWQMEYKQKGASRRQCVPPILNIKTQFRDRDVGRSDQLYKLFPGMTSYPGYEELRYRKMRFIPDCDVWHEFELGPLLREYFIYSLLRHFGVPAVDPIAFAQVTFVSSDTDFDQTQSYPYLILQRIDEDKDQIPFATQFSFARLIESSDTVWDTSGDRSIVGASGDIATVSLQYTDPSTGIGRTEELSLDPETAIRYVLLSDFTSLEDFDIVVHNVDYGLHSSGIWEHIPFDFDDSFYCHFSSTVVLNKIEQLPAEIQPSYKQAYYRISREIFDNPDNLNYMLALVDSYPFRDNIIKMKNTIKLRFYYYALYFSSPQFASDLGQEYVPFANQGRYMREAGRIGEMASFDTVCMEQGQQFILRDLGRTVTS